MDKLCPLRTAAKTRKYSVNDKTLLKNKEKKVREGKIKENINRKLDFMSEEIKAPSRTREQMKGDARD